MRGAHSFETRGRTAPEPLRRGELVRLAYRLGRTAATGVLTVQSARARPEVLVVRRGFLMVSELDTLGRQATLRLARLASLEDATWHFDGGTLAYPPGATQRHFALAQWARHHLENQLDAALAERLLADLAGVRLGLRAENAPDPSICDETDRRILAAMAQPRRLDQIWTLARTPRFRLLAFLHFLRAVDALDQLGVAAPAREPSGPVEQPRVTRWDPARDHATRTRREALRLLGVDDGATPETLKRAYRRLARVLHPDLHPEASNERRRELERKLVAVTEAYQRLVDRQSLPLG